MIVIDKEEMVITHSGSNDSQGVNSNVNKSRPVYNMSEDGSQHLFEMLLGNLLLLFLGLVFRAIIFLNEMDLFLQGLDSAAQRVGRFMYSSYTLFLQGSNAFYQIKDLV